MPINWDRVIVILIKSLSQIKEYALFGSPVLQRKVGRKSFKSSQLGLTMRQICLIVTLLIIPQGQADYSAIQSGGGKQSHRQLGLYCPLYRSRRSSIFWDSRSQLFDTDWMTRQVAQTQSGRAPASTFPLWNMYFWSFAPDQRCGFDLCKIPFIQLGCPILKSRRIPVQFVCRHPWN